MLTQPMEMNSCRFCGSPVDRSHGLPGFRYGDGTVICEHCHDTSVKSDVSLFATWKFVVQTCIDLGLLADWSYVKVRLRNTDFLKSVTGNENVIGLARTQWTGLMCQSDVTIRYGQPLVSAVETLAHEAGHIFCHHRNTRFTPQNAEEGFCNLIAYKVLQKMPPTFNPQHRIDALFANPDPIYGSYFRSEWETMKAASSWQDYLQSLKTTLP